MIKTAVHKTGATRIHYTSDLLYWETNKLDYRDIHVYDICTNVGRYNPV